MADVSWTFEKWEGTANDFVVLAPTGVGPDADLDPAAVRMLCDRHRGIGADGVLLITPPHDPSKAAVRMVVRNADGSRPEMCGNGVRCVALSFASVRDAVGASVTVETDAGLRACATAGESFDGAVEVDMGVITVETERSVAHHGHSFSLIVANAGNPHAVSFDPIEDHTFDALGAHLQHHALFPLGVNLERVLVLDPNPDALVANVAVFERGVGRTLACGTGACAVAAVLVARGEAHAGKPIHIGLAGGPLTITVSQLPNGNLSASMNGAARRVFSGTVTAPAELARPSRAEAI